MRNLEFNLSRSAERKCNCTFGLPMYDFLLMSQVWPALLHEICGINSVTLTFQGQSNDAVGFPK